MSALRPAIVIFLFLAVITGGVYPLLTTALGQWLFHTQANGSLIFEQPRLFPGASIRHRRRAG